MLLDTVKSDDWLLRSVKAEMAERGINVVSVEAQFNLHDLTYTVSITVRSGHEQFSLRARIYDHVIKDMQMGKVEMLQIFVNNFTAAYEKEMERLADIELFGEDVIPEDKAFRKPQIKEYDDGNYRF